MEKIITVDYFAKDRTRWGIQYIPWSEVERVLKGEIKRKFLSSLIGTKPSNNKGVSIIVMDKFLKDYYNIKD